MRRQQSEGNKKADLWRTSSRSYKLDTRPVRYPSPLLLHYYTSQISPIIKQKQAKNTEHTADLVLLLERSHGCLRLVVRGRNGICGVKTLKKKTRRAVRWIPLQDHDYRIDVALLSRATINASYHHREWPVTMLISPSGEHCEYRLEIRPASREGL